jgi:serine/threonine protein kinase
MGSSKKMKQLNTEIQLLKTLKHKNIEKMFASWVDGEKKTVNIITELFTSGSLTQYAPHPYDNYAVSWSILINCCLFIGLDIYLLNIPFFY